MIGSSSGISGLAAVEAEPLGAGEARVQEPLEGLGLDQLPEDAELASRVNAGSLSRSLHAFLQPGLRDRVADVHVLDADGPQ